MAKKFDDVNGVFSFEKSFSDWLEDLFTSRASSDYPSRLRRFFNEFYDGKGVTFNGRPLHQSLHQIIAMQNGLDVINRWIDDCLSQASDIKDAKISSNTRSALNRFRIFLNQIAPSATMPTQNASTPSSKEEEESPTLQQKSDTHLKQLATSLDNKSKGHEIKFSQKELKDIFIIQFRTEDRRLKIAKGEKGVAYPIKAMGPFINRECKDRYKMTKFFSSHADNIKILIRGGVATEEILDPKDYCLFKDIRSLTLHEPDQDGLRLVSVTLKDGSVKDVYSQNGSQRVRMKVRTSSDINRDHDKAIANVLKDMNPMCFPCLDIATKACVKTLGNKKPTEIKTNIYGILNSDGRDPMAYAQDLFDELNVLFDTYLSFTLMEGKANRKKSASV